MFLRITSGIICFALSFSSSFAFDKASLATHVNSLRAILTIDVWGDISLLESSRRANLLTGVISDIASLERIWNLRPTFDTTLLYRPYFQKYKLSCETAALSMILLSLGVMKSEDALIARLPFFPSPNIEWIWWDPDKEFVGSITGSQMGRTGYWVYAQPLIDMIDGDFYTESFALTWWLLTDEKIAKDTLIDLFSKMKSGARVMLWWDWCTDPGSEDGVFIQKNKFMRFFPISWKNECKRSEEVRTYVWKTPEGKIISGISWEHAFVLLGYIGKQENITHIIVWDTDTGRHIYPIYEWMRKWKLLQYRALLIRDFE